MRKRRTAKQLLEFRPQAVSLLHEGKTNRFIALQLGIDSHLVAKWRQEEGLPKSVPGGNRKDAKLREEVERHIRAGATLTDLARKYDVGVRTLSEWKRRLGVDVYRNPTGSWRNRVDVSLSSENHAALKALRDEFHTLGELVDEAVADYIRKHG